jgi:hypothetical protein
MARLTPASSARSATSLSNLSRSWAGPCEAGPRHHHVGHEPTDTSAARSGVAGQEGHQAARLSTDARASPRRAHGAPQRVAFSRRSARPEPLARTGRRDGTRGPSLVDGLFQTAVGVDAPIPPTARFLQPPADRVDEPVDSRRSPENALPDDSTCLAPAMKEPEGRLRRPRGPAYLHAMLLENAADEDIARCRHRHTCPGSVHGSAHALETLIKVRQPRATAGTLPDRPLRLAGSRA